MGKKGILLILTTKDFENIARDFIQSKTKNAKKQKSFVDDMKKSDIFKKIHNGGSEYKFVLQKKYNEAVDKLKKYIANEYDGSWNEKYVMKRHKERIKKLENEKVPFMCSKLEVPKIPSISQDNPSNTVLMVLNSIQIYCDQFIKVTPKNIVESIICDVYIRRLGNFCKRAYNILSRVKGTNIDKEESTRSFIIAKLCYGNDINIRVGLVQISTRINLLMVELGKALKIQEPDKQSVMIKNILTELTTIYPESKKYTKNFVNERFIEFRRTAKVFCQYVNTKLSGTLAKLGDILIQSAKVSDEDLADLAKKENIEKKQRQKNNN